MKPDLPDSVTAPLEAVELARLLAETGEVVVFADYDWRVWFVNDVYLAQTGLTRADIIGRTPFEYQPTFERTLFYEPIETCRRERRPMAAIGYSTLIGRAVLMRVFPLRDGMLLLANDATDSIVHQYQLAQRALEDGLTGLPNKLALVQDLQERLKAGDRLSIAMLGLHRLRAINDAQGFASGDLATIELASRLKVATQAGERLYRVTGDEYVLMSPATAQGAHVRAGQLLEVARQPLKVQGQVFQPGASIGVVSAPDQGDEPNLLLHRATMALRQAQRDGGDRTVIYDPDLEAANRLRIELEAEVRHALAHGEFTLLLQPKAAIHGQHVTGAEALIRWTHARRGMLSPAAFLPVVEECGLMPALDTWVLRRALAQVHELDRQGIAVPVSINLSVESLADPELVDRVRDALEEAAVAPELLEIEIPEGSLMRDVDTSARVLAALNALGVRISVDDFGTGYSSFAYLAHFPVHTLKVDRSFVADMTKSEASRKIVAGLVRLAHSLSLRVVAEGAETRAQMAMLKRMHCDEMQGFGYARPMPFDDFCEFLREHQAPEGPDPFSI